MHRSRPSMERFLKILMFWVAEGRYFRFFKVLTLLTWILRQPQLNMSHMLDSFEYQYGPSPHASCSFSTVTEPFAKFTVGTRVVPDTGLGEVETFWNSDRNPMEISKFHPQDAPKRVSSLQKWILHKILRFPIPRGVSRLLLGFENHKIHQKSIGPVQIGCLLTIWIYMGNLMKFDEISEQIFRKWRNIIKIGLTIFV